MPTIKIDRLTVGGNRPVTIASTQGHKGCKVNAVLDLWTLSDP